MFKTVIIACIFSAVAAFSPAPASRIMRSNLNMQVCDCICHSQNARQSHVSPNFPSVSLCFSINSIHTSSMLLPQA